MHGAVLQKIDLWLRAHEEELIENTCKLLRYPSIEMPAESGAPFGRPVKDALDFMLDLSRSNGMKIRNIENYVGWAEFGEGKPLIMSLGHLDVVPVGPGWKHDPFGAAIDNGYIYARGAVDDKGPTMASFYAMRAIKECLGPINVRFRSVFGCNEESGFKCVEKYNQEDEAPTFGIAPDSDWPLVHAEKGIADFDISAPLIKGELELLSIEGGDRTNIVIDKCRAVLSIEETGKTLLEELMNDHWDKNIDIEWLDDRKFIVTSYGKAAHGSTPYYGDSAAIRLFKFLKEICPVTQAEQYTHLLDLCDISGSGMGIQGNDDLSRLTSNVGIIKSNESDIIFTMNIRYPVTWSGSDIKTKCEKYLSNHYLGYKLNCIRDSKPLYFSQEDPMVKAILSAYEYQAGGKSKPKVMGGGTYARAVPNTVSIGTGWEGDGEPHETDERIRAKNLRRLSMYYAHILINLAYLALENKK